MASLAGLRKRLVPSKPPFPIVAKGGAFGFMVQTVDAYRILTDIKSQIWCVVAVDAILKCSLDCILLS